MFGMETFCGNTAVLINKPHKNLTKWEQKTKTR